ncbi:hypothetical protein D910_09166, partial [Dendroctonus ponderosae]
QWRLWAKVCVLTRQQVGAEVKQLNISRTTLRKILNIDLGMYAYKVQLVQELKQIDHQQRFRFANWALNKLSDDPGIERKIIFPDEAHFHLGGYVNKQSRRIWSTENPHVVLNKPMHPDRVTNKVYTDNPQTIDHLKQNILNVSSQIAQIAQIDQKTANK